MIDSNFKIIVSQKFPVKCIKSDKSMVIKQTNKELTLTFKGLLPK